MKLFYSYSHKDEDLRNQIEKHLTPLEQEGYIDQWHDRKILGGGRTSQRNRYSSRDI